MKNPIRTGRILNRFWSDGVIESFEIQSNACELTGVDKDTVPLRSVKPGDVLWELTMYASRPKSGQQKLLPGKMGRKIDMRLAAEKITKQKLEIQWRSRVGLDANELKDRTEVGDSFTGRCARKSPRARQGRGQNRPGKRKT